MAELGGAVAFADPIGGRTVLSTGIGHPDIASITDDLAEAEIAEEAEPLLVAKPRRLGSLVNNLDVVVQPSTARRNLHCYFFTIIFSQTFGQISGSARAVAGYQAQHQRRMMTVSEVGPVHRNQDVFLHRDLPWHPAGEAGPRACAKAFLINDTAGGASAHHIQRGFRPRTDAFGMQVKPEKPANETLEIF